MTRCRWITVLVAGIVAATGCGSSDESPSAVESDGFAVIDAWTRPTPTGASEAAIYVTVENRDAPDDRLIGSSSDRCMVMHPHLTTISDDDVASMITAEGDVLGLARGGRVEMAPNGLHLMCLGLADPFEAGDRFEIELQFSTHDPVVANVAVEQR